MTARGAWRLYVLGVIALALPFGIAFWLTTAEQQRVLHLECRRHLLSEAGLARATLAATWPRPSPELLARLARTFAGDGAHFAILSQDLDPLIAGEDILHDRLISDPVVRAARDAGSASDFRQFNATWYALAAVATDAPAGVIVLARPLPTPLSAAGGLWRQLLVVAAIAALTGLAVVMLWLRRRRLLVRRLVRGARNLPAGNLLSRVEASGSDELAMLAASLHVIRRRLARQVRRIEEQRAMLDALIRELREGVIVIGDNGRVLLMNPAAVRLLSLEGDSEAYIGKPVAGFVSEKTLGELMRPVPSDADTQRTAPRQARVELDSDSGPRTLRAHAAQLTLASPDGSGTRTTSRLVVLTDITELQRTIQMRTDFVANASHELRTPLSTIRAATEALLAMDLASDAEAAMNFAGVIERNTGRLEELVSDLLDLSKLEALESRFAPEEVRVARLLGELHDRFEDPLARGRLRWEASCSPTDLATVEINQHLQRLVLDNLVDNAIKYTEPGGLISVRLERAVDSLTVRVRDTGCGIPQEERKRVFERFYQVARDRSGQRPGTGLGLSIIRHAVSVMGGHVQLESEVGVGTEVSFTIPQPTLESVSK